MIIAIDTVFFTHSYSGITKVWEIILQNLNNLDKYITLDNNNNIDNNNVNMPTYEILLLIRGKTFPESLKNIIATNNIVDNINKVKVKVKVKITHININEFSYMSMHQDVDYLNFICKNNNINYFMSTYYTYCTIIPNILMIYDMIPEIFKLSPNHQWVQKDLAIKNASQFIVISKTTNNDLCKFYPHINLNKYPVSLIYNCVQPQLLQTQYDNIFYNEILVPNGVKNKQYIFSILSNNEKYKNRDLIINLVNKYKFQLSQVLSTSIPIILIIKQYLPNGYIIANGILYLSNIRNEIINILYKNALCYVCPSLYEGFGLPIFEAFSHNTPVIAINQPIFHEIAHNAINFIENNIDDLFDNICNIHKNINTPTHIINKRIENGLTLVQDFSQQKQIISIHNLFNSLSLEQHQPFMNIIFQSYNEHNIERRKELEYCINANLNNPYILYIHDLSAETDTLLYLPDIITKHPKYILSKICNTTSNTWLTYNTAFTYSNNVENINKYGSYWGIINCDIFLDDNSNWNLMRGKMNSNFVYAQSRHEFNILYNKISIKLDETFSKLYHSTTQDGWFYKAPLTIYHTIQNENENEKDKEQEQEQEQELELENINISINFELGMLGCDNAIADRLIKFGYKVINQPETFKLLHYDIARSKNSSNFLEKHVNETLDKHNNNNNNKPKNKHPERQGCYLVPNYDALLGLTQNIDLNKIINSIGGISNFEKYKIISEIYSSRIIINNPDDS